MHNTKRYQLLNYIRDFIVLHSDLTLVDIKIDRNIPVTSETFKISATQIHLTIDNEQVAGQRTNIGRMVDLNLVIDIKNVASSTSSSFASLDNARVAMETIISKILISAEQPVAPDGTTLFEKIRFSSANTNYDMAHDLPYGNAVLFYTVTMFVKEPTITGSLNTLEKVQFNLTYKGENL